MSVIKGWLEKAQSIGEQIVAYRREFHQIPELGFDLPQTTSRVASFLEDLGIQTTEVGGGLVGVIEGGSPEGPVIALRADMDAMPGQEATGLEFASIHDGRIHSCGHDAHMAILIGAAACLNEHKEAWRGKVKLIFQPAEELVSGARAMIEEGVLEDPEVDLILGLHVWQPIESGRVGLRPGAMMASTDTFEIQVLGKSAHGAMPHEGTDAIAASASFISNVQASLGRVLPSQENYVLTFGRIAGGAKANIIADKVVLEGTFRAFEPDVRDRIAEQIKKSLEAEATRYGTQWRYDLQHAAPPTINDPELTGRVEKSLVKIFGPENVLEYGPVLPAEDFSEYAARVPGVLFFLGVGSSQHSWPHHHPKFDLDEGALPAGAAALAQAVSDLSGA